MSTRLVQRGIVAALVCATIGAVFAAYLVPRHSLDSRRSDQVVQARHRIADALLGRTYYLEDVADMVGVHDDAAVEEFSRYAHVRGRDERAVISVQLLRRSPSGRLVPPADAGPAPLLVPPTDSRNADLADAAARPMAAHAVELASRSKRVAISAPVRLADGRAAFYLAVPVEAHRFSGLVSKAESQSAVVGLVDAQALVAQQLSSRPIGALQVRDGATALAQIGSRVKNVQRVTVPADGRRWTLSLDGGSLSPWERGLPWVILALGFGLVLVLALVLSNASRRRDVALRLARDRSTELAHSAAMIQRITGAIDESFYTYTIDQNGRAKTRFATPGWSRALALPDEEGDPLAAWQRALHPDDAAAYADARDRLRAGESTDLEFRVIGADGEVRWLWVREHPIEDNRGELLIDGVVTDISGRKTTEGALAVTLQRVERANLELEQANAVAEHLSRVDSLTGIFNRRHFSRLLADQLERPGHPAPAVLLIDLDHFKRVNDEHGHRTGDVVLRAAAKRIASILRGSASLARWGGEEFAVLAPATDRESATRLAERARRALADGPVQVDDIAVDLTASIGIAVAGDGLNTADALVDAADKALYAAKRAGRNCVRIFEPDERAGEEEPTTASQTPTAE
jgi:diguanylate cyclase (GGDEF)-like protein